MGCDIHVHTEVKIDGVWHHYGNPWVARNYALFGLMAGVRDGEQEPIVQPRGLPANATELTVFCARKWGNDGHSHSWLGADEIEALADVCKSQRLMVRRACVPPDDCSVNFSVREDRAHPRGQ